MKGYLSVNILLHCQDTKNKNGLTRGETTVPRNNICECQMCFATMEFFQANAPENNDHVYLHIFFCPPWWQHFLASVLPQV
jgi:hypothetical protein